MKALEAARRAWLSGLLVLALAPGLARPAGSQAVKEALELYRAGDAAGAAAVLERAVASDAAAAPRGAWVLLGWCRLRLAALDGARAAFEAALAGETERAEARTGLGFVALREGRTGDARAEFERSLALDADRADAWKGLGLALAAAGDAEAALSAFERAVALGPGDGEAAELLARARDARGVATERSPRPAVAGDAPPRHDVRAGRRTLEVRDGKRWRPFFVKGINLGTALPGRFPVEFPDDPALYRRWFDEIGELGANAVRLYTLHPPSLYRALREHNASRPEERLRLIQGVWVELPERHDFDDPSFRAAVGDEVRRVIDAVHGNLELPKAAGRAHGVYDADVSDDVLTYLLGREWEPFAVRDFDARKAGKPARFAGRFVQVDAGSPMEVWLAWLCETAAAHETDYYGMQHPVAFVSWPTLDPLHHPTESTAAEQAVFEGQPAPPAGAEVYDEDGVSVDPARIRATAEFRAGTFAAYHVYPYYPDFMILDPGYGQPRADGTVDRYRAYLDDLAAHHGDQPILIAEFGVPSSRDISHLHPEGRHHGGHTEVEQGTIDAELLQSIHDARMAGGVLFAWVDEWFKRNWAVANRVVPAERGRLWYNGLNPEQHYGLVAAFPGSAGPRVVLDGSSAEWAGVAALYEGSGRLRQLRATFDEGYLYLLLALGGEGRAIDWEREAFWIGIDTYGTEAGDHRLPPPVASDVAIGLEFLVRLEGLRQSRLFVDPPYLIFEGEQGRPCRSEPNHDGVFTDILAGPNRERYGRDGTHFPARTYSRSVLRHGSTDPDSPAFDSLADWIASADGSTIEMRIPWGLLNVTDPSSRRVIAERERRDGPVETAITEGFRFHIVALALAPDPAGQATIVDQLPSAAPAAVADYPLYTWPGWEHPTYRLRAKRSYDILRSKLHSLP